MVGAIAVAMLMIVPAASMAHPIVLLEKTTKDATCGVGRAPWIPGYDPVTHEMYVPNTYTHNITVLSGTCTEVGTIGLVSGANPLEAAFDPGNNYMYVTDEALNEVYVISGLTIVATVSSALFNGPEGIAFDAGFLGPPTMVVTNYGGNDLVAISGTTVSGPTGVGTAPTFVSYDPSRDTLLVANFGSANLTILNATSPFTSTHISASVGSGPTMIAFDPVGAVDYVANYLSSSVTIVGGFGVVYGTITGLKTAWGVAWDQAALAVFVTGKTADKVWEISGGTVIKKISTPSGSNLEGIAYDDFNDKVYVANYGDNTVYVYS